MTLRHLNVAQCMYMYLNDVKTTQKDNFRGPLFQSCSLKTCELWLSMCLRRGFQKFAPVNSMFCSCGQLMQHTGTIYVILEKVHSRIIPVNLSSY